MKTLTTLKVFAKISAALVASGCATVTATPVTKKNPDPSGLRVSPARQIVMSTGAGSEVINIADPCIQYAVRFDAIFAVNNTEMNLNENGTLKSIDTELDTTKALEVIKDLVAPLVPGASSPISGSGALRSEMQLFDFVCDGDGGVQAVPLLDQPITLHSGAMSIATPAPIATDGQKRSIAPGG